jgi:hypothetical protein
VRDYRPASLWTWASTVRQQAKTVSKLKANQYNALFYDEYIVLYLCFIVPFNK